MNLESRLIEIRNQIKADSLASKRNPYTVLLLAVSKTQPPSVITEAYRLGLRHFGENYCQEALSKQQALGAYDISWHFIGPIQSNKTKTIAANFSWVHSVNSLRIAQRLSEQRPDYLGKLNVCLQVNISNEDSKSGIDLCELADLCDEIAGLPRLSLRGVMAIPAPQEYFELQRIPYKILKTAVMALKRPELDTFSFGMSGDLRAAIFEGATIVRIGTALFGARN